MSSTKKLTNEIVDYRLNNRNIKRIGNYINTKIKIEWKCLNIGCEKMWFATPSDILNNRGCPRCGGHERLTNEIVDEKLIGRSLKRIGNIIKSHEKCEFQCLNVNCGNTWFTTPNHILHSHSACPKCYGNEKITQEEFDKKLYKHNHNIKRISEYKGSGYIIRFKCMIDNYEWETLYPNSIYTQKSGCPKCSKNDVYTNEKVDNAIIFWKKNIKRLENVADCKTPISFQCCKINCKHIFKTQPNRIVLYKSATCPMCNHTARYTNEIVDDRLKNKQIKRLGKCKNSNTHILFKCMIKNCEEEFYSTPEYVVKSNHACPKCNMRKGELYIKNLLQKFCPYFDNLNYRKILNFNNKKYFPDFNIMDKVYIERNGEQHYRPVTFNGISKEKANINFIKQQKRDGELRRYCTENNIYLLEIPYYWKEEKIIKEIEKINQLFISDSTISLTNCSNV